MNMEVPPNVRIFTANAVSMCANTPTRRALHVVGRYLRSNRRRFASVPINALMSALQLVMTNNVFTFGDTSWHQKTGTAMGTPPRPRRGLLCSLGSMRRKCLHATKQTLQSTSGLLTMCLVAGLFLTLLPIVSTGRSSKPS